MKKLLFLGFIALMMSTSTTFAHTGKDTQSNGTCGANKHDVMEKDKGGKCHKHEAAQSGCRKVWKNQPKGDCDET